jgi:hypothetical protein
MGRSGFCQADNRDETQAKQEYDQSGSLPGWFVGDVVHYTHSKYCIGFLHYNPDVKNTALFPAQ